MKIDFNSFFGGNFDCDILRNFNCQISLKFLKEFRFPIDITMKYKFLNTSWWRILILKLFVFAVEFRLWISITIVLQSITISIHTTEFWLPENFKIWYVISISKSVLLWNINFWIFHYAEFWFKNDFNSAFAGNFDREILRNLGCQIILKCNNELRFLWVKYKFLITSWCGISIIQMIFIGFLLWNFDCDL